jgi:tetratricopeptide (TPR) repeat protein
VDGPLDGDADARLQRALDEVQRTVELVRAALIDPTLISAPSANGSGEELTPAVALAALDAEISAATRVVLARAGHAAWAARFDDATWSTREADLIAGLDADLNEGTAAWFEAWADALTCGAWVEARRILGLTHPLADWAVWMPDRAAALMDAAENVADSPDTVALRMANLIDVLLDEDWSDTPVWSSLERLSSDGSRSRVELTLFLVRMLAGSRSPYVGQLVSRARAIARRSGPNFALDRAVRATAAFAARRGGDPSLSSRGIGRSTTPTDLWSLHEYLVERTPDLSREGLSEQQIDEAIEAHLAEVRGVIASLPSVAGFSAGLSTLFEDPTAEFAIALAERLADEGQFRQASDVLDRSPVPTLARPLRLAAVEVAGRILDKLGYAADEEAAAWLDIGDVALRAGSVSLAADSYERARRLRDDDPHTLRVLADALQAHASQQPAPEAIRMLQRAAALEADATRIEPVTEASAWAYDLRQAILSGLNRFLPDGRAEIPWRILDAAIACVELVPEAWRWWTQVFDALTAIGLHHTARHLAVRYAQDFADTNPARLQPIYCELNAGDGEAALALLQALPADVVDTEGDWVPGLTGFACLLAGRLEEGLAILTEIDTGDGVGLYRVWRAEALTRSGAPDAEEEWGEIWRRARLDDNRERDYAVEAALCRGWVRSVRELAPGAIDGEALTLNCAMGPLASAVADIVETGGSVAAFENLRAALGRTLTRGELELSAALLLPVLEHALADRVSEGSLSDEVLLWHARLDEVVDGERRRLEEAVPADPDAAMRFELEWARAVLSAPLVDGVLDRLGSLLDRIGRDGLRGPGEDAVEPEEADAAPAADEPQDDTITAYVPPSYFSEMQGREEEHELFVRGLPLARAGLGRITGSEVADRHVQVAVDDACEPNLLWISLRERSDWAPIIDDWSGWYCPSGWLVGLSGFRRETARPTAIDGLYRVDPPDDATGRMNSWSAAEVVARCIMYTAYDFVQQAAPPEPDGSEATE